MTDDGVPAKDDRQADKGDGRIVYRVEDNSRPMKIWENTPRAR